MEHAVNLAVFIPTYENDDLLHSCLESIGRFIGLKSPSVVILDDSETDIVSIFITSYKDDGRIRVQYHPRSRDNKTSHIENWNRMFDIIEISPSIEWFQLRHHDDQLKSMHKRDIFFSTLASHECDLVITPIVKRVMKLGCFEINRYHCHPWLLKHVLYLNPEILYFFNYIGPTASLWIRKDSNISRIRFDSSLTWLVDCNWYSRILMAAREKRIKVVPGMQTVSMPNSSSITSWLSTRNMKSLVHKELAIVMPKSRKHYRLKVLTIASCLKAVNWICILLAPIIVKQSDD